MKAIKSCFRNETAFFVIMVVLVVIVIVVIVVIVVVIVQSGSRIARPPPSHPLSVHLYQHLVRLPSHPALPFINTSFHHPQF